MSVNQLSIFKYMNVAQSFCEICDILECEKESIAWPDKFGEALKTYLIDNKKKPIKTLSLFSGAGGLDIGFTDLGFEIVESVEVESKFCKTLELNSGKGKRFERSVVNNIDIREFDGKRLKGVEFIIGGPPCQTFSAAGRRAAGVSGTSDQRGTLFLEYVRLLEEIKPRGFLFENVYGITGAEKGEPWKEIVNSFSNVGYKLSYRILDAADYGVPQHRERLLIVGIRGDEEFKFPRPTHGPDSIDNANYYNAEQALMGLESEGEKLKNGINGRYGYLLNDIPPGLNYSFYTEKMGHPNPVFAWRSKFSDFLYKADPMKPVRTIKAQGGQYTGPFHWENRPFTLSEYKRLQTFPDDYEISGSNQKTIQQIGNSVPPQLARIMALAIRNQLFQTEFPFKVPLLEEGEELGFRKRKRSLTKIYQFKARQAIEAVKEHKPILPNSKDYKAVLKENFEFKKTKANVYDFKVNVEWDDILEISIYDKEKEDKKIEITIEPADTNWNINVSKVKLCSYSKNIMSFTALWKAFEMELIDNMIKADLVQLNGYYQYKAKLKSKLVFSNEIGLMEILTPIVEGRITATLLSTSELASIWSIPENEIIDKAEMLRDLGYEIRNSKTNPQIEDDYWLIPYSFPTLNPMSVQLRKKLR